MYKILLVDDEEDIVDTLQDILEEKLTTEVHTATNGLDAFIKAQKNKYDLIITDHQMPFMKGSALIIGIRTRENKNKETPIFMLSAYIDEEIRSNLKIGQVEFIDKPFEPVTFIQRVREILI